MEVSELRTDNSFLKTEASSYFEILACIYQNTPMVSLQFFIDNPSGRTIALGSTQLLIEMSTRNISWGGKGDRCVGLTTLPPSCADCLEIWESQPPGTLRACPGLYRDCIYVYLPKYTTSRNQKTVNVILKRHEKLKSPVITRTVSPHLILSL